MDPHDIESALAVARRAGYLEVEFTSDNISGFVDEPSPPHPVAVPWEKERSAAGRHAIIVVLLRGEYFVTLSFRCGPEMEYVLAEMFEAFQEHFGENPGFDPDLGIGLFSPLVPRDVAIAAARALVAIDEQRRDPDVEVAYQVMTS